ncbi:MAG: hypothetical protein LQ350_007740 [Teloschistes chrysophthalmus]|nr:MAG: hypothetical protein LQ350_007740 [Niorma chrysophthalma]
MWSRFGILAGALLGLIAIAHAEDLNKIQLDQEAQSDIEEFNRLLDQVDPPSLHAALHDYSPKKFKHGMFKEDRTAVEAIHKEEPSLASSIIAVAKRQELPKRQDVPSNATVPTTSQAAPANPQTTLPVANSPTTDAAQPPSTANVATPVPVGPVQGSTLSAPNAPTATVGGAGNQPPDTTTSTSTSPNAPNAPVGGGSSTTSAPAAGDTAAAGGSGTTSAVGGVTTPSLTAGQLITTTNAQGVTIVSTIGGGYVTLSRSSNGNQPQSTSMVTTRNSQRTSRTSIVLHTTTLPDGMQSTVTAVTVVPNTEAGATPSGTAGAGSGTGTAAGNPSLQTGVAGKMGGMGWEIVCLLGGAVGVAMMM